MAPGEGNPQDDLAAIEQAVDSLDENGVDTNPEDVEGVLSVVDALIETAEENHPDNEEGLESLYKIRDPIQAVADGEADDETAEEALQASAFLGSQMVEALIQRLDA